MNPTVHRDKFRIIKPTRCTNFSIYFGMKLYMFRTVPLSIIRSFSLYTQQWYTSSRFADSLQAGSVWNTLILLSSCQQTGMAYNIVVCTVTTPDDGQRNCPKHVVSFQNKIEKLVHLVGFIVRNVPTSVTL